MKPAIHIPFRWSLRTLAVMSLLVACTTALAQQHRQKQHTTNKRIHRTQSNRLSVGPGLISRKQSGNASGTSDRGYAFSHTVAAVPADAGTYLPYAWKSIGPTPTLYSDPARPWGDISGRVSSVRFDPIHPATVYIAAANGGVWKSTDLGKTWEPKSDFEPTLSSGALAVDPCDSNVVYYGTGDATYTTNSYYGKGIFKSIDGGEHWKQFSNGLPQYTYVNRIVAGSTSETSVEPQWSIQHKGYSEAYNRGLVVGFDSAGNMYVGASTLVNQNSNSDYLILKFDAQGKPSASWPDMGDGIGIRRISGVGTKNDYLRALVVDSIGNLYVTGQIWMDQYNTYVGTAAFDSSGRQRWLSVNSGHMPAGTIGNSIALDTAGNVVVSGWTEINSTPTTGVDILTIKYDRNGNQLWLRQYDGPLHLHDFGTALSLDRAGNAYVTGKSYGADTSSDFVVIKYDRDGNQSPTWPDNGFGTGVRRWSGTGNTNTRNDEPVAIAADNFGNVAVTGQAPMPGQNGYYGTDIVTIKYDSAGVRRWVRTYNGPGNDEDDAVGLVIDGNGGVFVTGYTHKDAATNDYVTMKYDPDGTAAWTKLFNSPSNGDDIAHAITMDEFGDVYVAGTAHENGFDFTIIKYANATGDERWIQRYKKPGSNYYDVARAVVVRARRCSTDVYVGGYADNSTLTVVKFSGARKNYLLASLGNSYLTNTIEGGLYKSVDDGQTWVQKLKGQCDDIVATLSGDTVYAIGHGTYYQMSTDAGANFHTPAGSGLPATNGVDRYQIGICRTRPKVLYVACARTGRNRGISLWKSTNSGATFAEVPGGRTIAAESPSYSLYLYVHPSDDKHVYVGCEDIWRSSDGATFENITKGFDGGLVHPDQHDMDFHPKHPDTIMCASDGGVYYSADGGTTWINRNRTLTLTQFYQIASSPIDPGSIIGGTWDNGVQRSGNAGTSWSNVIGGDGVEVCFNRKNPQQAIAALYQGSTGGGHARNLIYRSSDGGRHFNSIEQAMATEDGATRNPVVSHPTLEGVFYLGRNALFRSTDGGATWAQISETLDGVSKDPIEALAISDSQPDVMYASCNDKLFKSIDGGKHWAQTMTFLSPYRVTRIRVHPDSPDTLLITLSGFTKDQELGSVELSTNGGASTVSITTGLPTIPVHDVLFNPNNPTTFIAATDTGVFISSNSGGMWQRLADSLPNSPSWSFDFNNDTLRVGTFGRGIWQIGGPFSVPLRPKLHLPVHKAVGQPTIPTLKWRRTTSALSYKVDVARDPGFTLNVFNRGPITDTMIIVPANTLELGTTYYWRVSASNARGISAFSETWQFRTADVTSVDEPAPDVSIVLSNRPNPFTTTTDIEFSLPQEARVSIDLYDMLGRRITAITAGRIHAAGRHELTFDATGLPDGRYLYKLRAESTESRQRYVQTSTMLIEH